MPDAPPAFHLLAKPTGAVCNLDCSYCFFLSKEMLYPGSRFRMADELLEAYLRQLIEAHAGVPEVTIAWQGGEPTLMGVEFFRRSVELANQYLQARAARRLHDPDERHAARRGVGRVLQGARLPRRDLDRRAARAARRLPRQQGRQGLVRPGDARPRAPAGGRRRVERAHDRARRERRPRPRGLPLPARRVRRALRPVHPDHRARRRGRRRRRRCRGRSWRDRPLYVQEGDRVTGRSVDRRAVRPLPDRRLRGVGAPRRRRGVRADVRRRARELGRRAARPLRPLGDLRARARARAHRRPLLLRPLRRARATSSGTSRRRRMLELVASQQQRQFGLDKRDTLPQFCLECDVRFACHGGCPKDRFIRRPTASPASTTSAPASRTSSTTSTGRCGSWASCCAQNRAPSEIVQLYAAEDAKRGRNDPCTCGCGRKWKHCHGAETLVTRIRDGRDGRRARDRMAVRRARPASGAALARQPRARGRPPTASRWSRTATA